MQFLSIHRSTLLSVPAVRTVCPVADSQILHFLPATVKEIKLQETFTITAVNKRVAKVCHVPSLHSQRIGELMYKVISVAQRPMLTTYQYYLEKFTECGAFTVYLL
ncbi:Hermansky-Pudlak syndrome 3 protein [Platysternon megacephalum]|uniref:Hermansky-Pudlak syndrome 3 protein n=1 Tax=Platysternon megacephalum TaxID=55544 RepID=A0A4D9EJ95_9SAUR|nr:Hermansky-Pudlak syndrome 3 protein [Platysternon megacephalum]